MFPGPSWLPPTTSLPEPAHGAHAPVQEPSWWIQGGRGGTGILRIEAIESWLGFPAEIRSLLLCLTLWIPSFEWLCQFGIYVLCQSYTFWWSQLINDKFNLGWLDLFSTLNWVGGCAPKSGYCDFRRQTSNRIVLQHWYSRPLGWEDQELYIDEWNTRPPPMGNVLRVTQQAIRMNLVLYATTVYYREDELRLWNFRPTFASKYCSNLSQNVFSVPTDFSTSMREETGT